MLEVSMLEVSMLKGLAIVFGVVIAATRLMGVVFPGFIRKFLKLMLEEKGALLLMLVYGALVGGLFIYGFRLEYAAGDAGWQAYVMLVFGILIALMTLLFLAVPKMLVGCVEKFTGIPPASMRLLCALGVVVGALIFLLGLSM